MASDFHVPWGIDYIETPFEDSNFQVGVFGHPVGLDACSIQNLSFTLVNLLST
jgi:hypothetical protein